MVGVNSLEDGFAMKRIVASVHFMPSQLVTTKCTSTKCLIVIQQYLNGK